MEYSVCVSSVYGRLSIPEALPRLRAIGYSAYEFWTWRDKDLKAIARAQAENGLKAVAMCANFTPLNVPERRGEYLRALREDLRAARELDCEMLLLQAGPLVEGQDRAPQHASIVEGLRAAAPLAEDAGITLALEPLNKLVDHIGYYLDRSAEAFEIVREVSSPRVRVVFDVYHQQITEGNLIVNLTENLADICHVHIAGNPGRHEPLDRSEVCYPAVLQALREAGYAHRVGLEYIPLRDPDEGLREILEKMPL